ncbi:hypothetical protein D3C80_1945710 [compost metagenome]
MRMTTMDRTNSQNSCQHWINFTRYDCLQLRDKLRCCDDRIHSLMGTRGMTGSCMNCNIELVR